MTEPFTTRAVVVVTFVRIHNYVSMIQLHRKLKINSTYAPTKKKQLTTIVPDTCYAKATLEHRFFGSL